MAGEANPSLGRHGPEPSARALVLAAVLGEGGVAEVESVILGSDNPDAARRELLQLAGAGILKVDGDQVTLELNDEGWRRLAATLAAAVVQLAEGLDLPTTHVLAQAVEQVPTGAR